MKTRTLLLLAVVCGMAILVAGTVQLLRVAGQENKTTLGMHAAGRAGDAAVVVDDASLRAGELTVTVTIGGVDDDGGLAGFRLVRTGADPVGVTGGTCTGFSTAKQQCTLAFVDEGADGDQRLLLFSRADETVRWSLDVTTATT